MVTQFIIILTMMKRVSQSKRFLLLFIFMFRIFTIKQSMITKIYVKKRINRRFVGRDNIIKQTNKKIYKKLLM